MLTKHTRQPFDHHLATLLPLLVQADELIVVRSVLYGHLVLRLRMDALEKELVLRRCRFRRRQLRFRLNWNVVAFLFATAIANWDGDFEPLQYRTILGLPMARNVPKR